MGMEILKIIITVCSMSILVVLEIVIHIMGICAIISYRSPINQDSKMAFWNGVMISSIIVAIGIILVAIFAGWLV